MFKRRKLISLSFPILIIANKSFANTSEPPAKMIKTDQTYLLTFTDGRVAQFFHQLGPKFTGTIDMKQIENTCEPERQLVRCQMNFQIRPYKLDVRWVKNPDNARLGQVVQTEIKNGEYLQAQPLEASVNTLSWFYMHTSQAKDMLNIGNDQIRCDNFDWLMQSESLPDLAFIQSWSAEAMITNDDTKISENSSLSGVNGLTLKRVDAKNYAIDSFRLSFPFENPQNFPTYISAQVINLTFRSPLHKKTCQVSFEMNAGKIISLISSPEYNSVLPETLQPAGLEYWHYSGSPLNSEIQRLLTNSDVKAK